MPHLKSGMSREARRPSYTNSRDRSLVSYVLKEPTLESAQQGTYTIQGLSPEAAKAKVQEKVASRRNSKNLKLDHYGAGSSESATEAPTETTTDNLGPKQTGKKKMNKVSGGDDEAGRSNRLGRGQVCCRETKSSSRRT